MPPSCGLHFEVRAGSRRVVRATVMFGMPNRAPTPKFDFGMPANSPSGDDGDSFGALEAPASSRDTRLPVGEIAAQQFPLLSPDSRIATHEA